MNEVSLFGLIGHPLSHSFSAGYFNKKFRDEGLECSYLNFEIEKLEDFRRVLADNPGLRGLNVTIPYKERILKYIDEIDPEAGIIGAANTISINDGKLTGYNTDHTAFSESLKPLLKGGENRALVLGAGGASRAICYALKNIGIDYTVVTRRARMEGIDYGMLDEKIMKHHQIIVNTTPIGTDPDIDLKAPIPYKWLRPEQLLYDLVYNPEVTAFMKEGMAKGCRVKNGYEMLARQAELSWRIWNG